MRCELLALYRQTCAELGRANGLTMSLCIDKTMLVSLFLNFSC
jgi:hypothetical protein